LISKQLTIFLLHRTHVN